MCATAFGLFGQIENNNAPAKSLEMADISKCEDYNSAHTHTHMCAL